MRLDIGPGLLQSSLNAEFNWPPTIYICKWKKSFKITKDRVGGIPGNLVLGSITDQVLHRSESNIRGCGPFALIIHYYLYSFISPHWHTWIRCTQINPNSRVLSLPLVVDHSALGCWPLSCIKFKGMTSRKYWKINVILTMSLCDNNKFSIFFFLNPWNKLIL